MTSNSTNRSKPFVYIFSSASRPLYRQNILDSMCIPNGYIMHYRYEQKHVHDEVWRLASEAPETLQGSTGICSFVDQQNVSGKEPLEVRGLYPFREIEVRQIETDGGVLHVYFKVSRYVYYAAGTGHTSSAYESQMRDLLGTHVPATNYIAMSAKSASIQPASRDPQDQAVAWTRIVDQLLDVSDFKASLFYRVVSLRRLLPEQEQPGVRGGERKPIEVEISEVLPLQSGYRLPSGGSYGLSLSFYRRAGTEKAVQKAILTPSLDGTHFAYNPGPIQVSFRYDKHELSLISRTVTEDSLTVVQVRLDEANEKELVDTAARSEGPVSAPQPTFLVQLKAPRRQIWAAFGLFFVGTLFTGAASTFLVDPWKGLAVAVGSLSTTGALIWLNRRLK